MEREFWLERWRTGQIGFHESSPNALLVRHLGSLSLSTGDRLFVPLCGKTLDIGWLLGQGLRVCGIELSESAVAELFAQLGMTPAITPHGDLQRWAADDLDIFVGDVFALSASLLGAVHAVYDRAALIALPETMRRHYAVQLLDITDVAPQLLICLEYEQSLMAGPPFSIREDAVRDLYRDHYRIRQLERSDVADGLKGKLPATEVAWLLARP